jgi:hypothetical protein
MSIPIADYNRQIQAWIREKWPSKTQCPLCRTSSGWTLSVPAEMPLRTDVEDTAAGQAIAVIPLTCNRCAYIVCLNAVSMGILPLSQTTASGQASGDDQ